MHELTQEELKQHLSYDPETGIFIRLKSGWSTRVGKPAGTYDTKGHLQAKINGRLHLLHRLAWLYVHGEWPALQIDHINGVKDDNRIANLRLATARQNSQNRRRAQSDNKSSGLLGVSFDRRMGKYFGQIINRGSRKFLGYFDDPDLAHEAYLKAKANLHEFGEIASKYRVPAAGEMRDAA
jgi:hypothetical protein